MCNIVEYTQAFSDVTVQTLADIFGVEATASGAIEQVNSVQTSRSFIVSLYYTGSVYGEYLLALDEETAARIIGWDEPITDDNHEEVRDQICDALTETLNMIVGESIVLLQASYPKLTLTAPRVFFGTLRYPQFKTGRSVLMTDAGEIECHFCLDLMRLDLATSYNEAMQTLLDVNAQLKEANRNLAEQQAQLVHTEKMASIGILASGVAHEINNPLFFVDANLATLNEYIQIIESTLSQYDRLRESTEAGNGAWIRQLDAIRDDSDEDIEFVMEDTKQLMVETCDGVGRIKGIVQSLKDFSQAEQAGIAEADVNHIVETSCDLLQNHLPTGCRLEKRFGDVPKLICNAAEIGQLLASLILNSMQAIEGDGEIVITSAANDEEVVLTVEDTGQGIGADNVDRIFDPFYSTKPEGEGAGLGLSIAYGIVQKHNGSISVSSQLGSGTTMTIHLPLASELLPA